MQASSVFIRFGQEKVAQLLAAYLRGRGIPCTVRMAEPSAEGSQDAGEQGQPYLLSLENDAQRDEATAIAKEFLNNPNDPKFQRAAWESGEISTSNSSMFTSSSMPSVKDVLTTPFTISILLANVFVYLASLAGAFDFWYGQLTIQYFDQLSESHQWWRLFTPNFLHFSATHIVFNLIWWWIFGSQLERVFGSFALIVLFIVASLFANISQLVVTGPNFGGMSGVVYALFGFVWWIGWLRPQWGIGIPKGFIVFLLIWLIVGYADLLPVNVANQAHTFGLISGCLLALVLHLLVSINSAKGKQQ